MTMQIIEFQQPIMFHTTLNPYLWNGQELGNPVRVKLLEIAKNFIEFLKVESIPLRDIIITGSQCNWTYTPHSDLDLHIIVDMQRVYNGSALVEQFFDSKRRLWNKTYDPLIHNIPVEIYVEDDDEHVEGNAYSLLTDQWLTQKPLTQTEYNDRSVRAKFNSITRGIERSLARADHPEDMTRIMRKLKSYRQSGLDQHGEYSTENLVFKALRNAGWLDKINKQQVSLTNKVLSLD